MTIFDFFLQLDPIVSTLVIVAVTAIIIFLGSKGIEVTSRGKTLRIFSRKKDNALQNALVMEKIIEFAYEISYRKKEKKIKNQMNYTEQIFDEMLTSYEKSFRSDLEDMLKERTLSIINLEKHPDLEMFKICLTMLKANWKNIARTFFNELFEKLQNLSSSDFETEKEQFVFSLNKEREDLFNEIYKDQIRSYSRDITRSNIYYLLKKSELQYNHILKELVNHAKSVSERIKIEEYQKRQELETFLKENLL